MKKLILTALLLSAIAGTVSATVASTTPVPAKDTGSISVNLSTVKELSPNIAEVTITVETSDKTMQKASDENKRVSELVYSGIKAIIAQGDYVKTANFTANPTYIYTKDKKVFDKYVVTNNVVVNTKNVNLVSRIVDTAITKGATSVEKIDFSVSNYDEACNAALAEVTKKSHAQATAVANSVGAKVTGIKTLNTSCSEQGTARVVYGMNRMAASPMADTATPIESGKIQINVRVNAEYFVK